MVMDAKKILVVDDDRIIQKTMSLKLKTKGYQVLSALDGSTAVSCVRKDVPDLILLDINFPPDVAFGFGGGVQWDGFLIMTWLRRMDEVKNTPFIVMTGGDPSKYKDRAISSGAVGFFQKPINYEELVIAIRSALGEETDAVAMATVAGAGMIAGMGAGTGAGASMGASMGAGAGAGAVTGAVTGAVAGARTGVVAGAPLSPIDYVDLLATLRKALDEDVLATPPATGVGF